MPGGRPPKYGKKMIKMAKEYIQNCNDKVVNVLESENETTGRTRYLTRLKVNLPKIEGLCIYLDIRRSTAYEWANKYEEFSDIIEEINKLQSQRLIDGALSGEYNSIIAKLLLSKHGYKEEKDITSGGKPIGKILDELE